MSSFTWADILARARTDVLWDAGSADQRFSDAQLLRFANTFIAACYPTIWVPKVDSSLTTTETTGIQPYTNRRYALPADVPQTEYEGFPIYRVEIGPMGGERIADNLSFTDRYYPPLRGLFGGDRAWRIERHVSTAGAETNTLVISPHMMVPYDRTGTYRYYIRLYYAGAVPLLVSTSDVFQGPDNAVPVLLQWMRLQAQENQMRASQNEPDRLGTIGAISRDAIERVRELVLEWGGAMQRPRVIR